MFVMAITICHKWFRDICKYLTVSQYVFVCVHAFFVSSVVLRLLFVSFSFFRGFRFRSRFVCAFVSFRLAVSRSLVRSFARSFVRRFSSFVRPLRSVVFVFVGSFLGICTNQAFPSLS